MWPLIKGTALGSLATMLEYCLYLVLQLTIHKYRRWWLNLPFELRMSDVGLEVVGMKYRMYLPPCRQLESVGNYRDHVGDGERSYPASL